MRRAFRRTGARALAALLLLAGAAHAAPPQLATFAGGCFWCTEADFEKVPGVLSAVSGYTGGRIADPDYEAVSAGTTGHAEAVQLRFDPAVVSYERLLEIYWRSIDPLTPDAQFCDHGSQYRSAIFVHDAAQKAAALMSKRALEQSGRFDRPIVTQIVEAGVFYPAEDYHQDYARRNPVRYAFYRNGCGRDRRLKALWGAEAGRH